MEEPKYIKTWEELSKIKSKTHDLEIDDCCGWIIPKVKSNEYHQYLSTHTFYGNQYKASTELLQSCGFNVELANWDELGW